MTRRCPSLMSTLSWAPLRYVGAVLVLRLVLVAIICIFPLGLSACERTAARPSHAYATNAEIGNGLNSIYRNLDLSEPIDIQQRQKLVVHFQRIHEAGFQSVRMALLAFQYMDNADQIDRRWLAWLEARVDAALSVGLTVIIDEHDSQVCGNDVVMCHRRLDAYWRQVAQHFSQKSNRLIFEVLNEPHGQMNADAWNRQIVSSLNIIRKTNPTRTVIIGPSQWYSIKALDDLIIPEDDHNLIVTIHYYEPFNFTHQSAFWIPQTKGLENQRWGSAHDHAKAADDFNKLAAWAKRNRRPINVGEYGAYMKGPLDDRVAWVATVVQLSDLHGFSKIYWPFSFDKDEVDPTALRKAWGEDAVLKAVLK